MKKQPDTTIPAMPPVAPSTPQQDQSASPPEDGPRWGQVPVLTDGMRAEIKALVASVTQGAIDRYKAERHAPPQVRLEAVRDLIANPSVSDNGHDLIIPWNPGPDEADEISLPSQGKRLLSTGLIISVPDGWEAIITHLGTIPGDRTEIMRLRGEGVREVRLWITNQDQTHLTLHRGQEMARLSLYRLPPLELQLKLAPN